MKLGPKTGVEVNPYDMNELRELARSPKRVVADRARVVLGAVEGQSCPQTAAVLGWTPIGVANMRGKWKKFGLAAVRGKPHLGREPKLANAALAAVEPLLAEHGRAWTVPRLGEALRQQGVEISQTWLTQTLKKTSSRSAVRATR
jgi:transposase